MNNLITLTVHRDWKGSYNQTTILKDNQGKVKAIFSSSIKRSVALLSG